MKRILLFLAVTGLASASAITLNTWDPLGASNLINAPSDTFTPVDGQAVTATVGGLCSGAAASCPTTGSGLTPNVLTFTLGTSSTLNILLQDLDSVGDVFEVILTNTGTSQAYDYSSTAVSIGGTTAQSCYQSSLSFATANNSCMNVTTPTLAAGNYSINVWDVILSYVGGTSPFGGSIPSQTTQGQEGRFSPAAFELEVNATAISVPEPASFAMLGLGGLALSLLRRRTVK
jgi:hypothetical protein